MTAPPSVWNAVHAVDAVFEKRLRPPKRLCMHCGPPWTEEQERFDAIVRQHRAHRLTLPIEAIRHASFGHGSAMVQNDVRRLAWFVPSILATSLAPEGNFARTLRLLNEGLTELLELPPDRPAFSRPETAALASFLRAAFDWRLDESPSREDDVRALGSVAIAAGCREAIFDETARARIDDLFFVATTDAQQNALSAIERYLRDPDTAPSAWGYG